MAGQGHRRRRLLRWLSCPAIAFAVAALVWAGLETDTFDGLQLRAADSIFPRGDPDPRITVVGVDAASIATSGEAWPWPRDLQAAVVSQLADAGARVVALDFVYNPARPGDDELAAALRRTDAVVASAPTLGRQRKGLYQVRERLDPTVDVAASAAVGHTAVVPDPSDGIVRVVPLVVESGRDLVPAFSLAVLARYKGVDPIVTVRPDGVQVADRVVPTTDAKELLVSFPDLESGGKIRYLSASDVAAGTFNPAAVRGKVVFVGVTDPTITDRVLTPLDDGRGLPGVLLHAAAFDTMLTNSYLSTVPTSNVVLWAFALALVVAFAVQFAPLWAAALVTVLTVAGYTLFAFIRAGNGVIMNVVYPLVAIVVTVLVSGSVRYTLEARQRRRVDRLFAQYVPPDVARSIVDDDRSAVLAEGESVRATVLFCDIRGFTPLTADLSPSQVRALLDVYYDALSRVVLDHGGTTLRYTGDEVYAVFGAPAPLEHHEQVAVDTALAMHAACPELNGRLADAGIPPVDYGIGIHTGDLVSAIVGSDVRRQYAVIGNAVNLGARLCAQARRSEVVVSDATFTGLTSATAPWAAESASLKGFDGLTTIHRLDATRATTRP